VIFLVYAKATIASAFMITAGMFGATSLFGYVTRKDLSTLGGICFMALIGIILASVVNMFMGNETLYWLITYAGVAIFVGLTAYDTQKIKAIAYQTAGAGEVANKLAIVGSLILYLDFINLLLFILRILGSKRR
jgi:FtsH-binding integral membrane protein